MNDPGQSPSAALRRLVNGFQVSQAIHVAAVLGIADLLSDGPRSSDDLAEAADAHPDALYRLLRALASVGVFQEEDGRRFALTPLGDGLRSDASEPMRGWAELIGRPYYFQAWASLLHAVRTGENAFRHVHGVDVWEYRVREPEEGAIFDRAMRDATRRTNRSILGAYDFGRFSTVADVGGGNGALLAALLAEHPDMRGILFDQPQVVETAGEVLRAAGVADRCRIVGGSFFDSVPEGADAYLLKSVIHDWEDAEAIAILRCCRRAVADGGALLLVEWDIGPPNQEWDPKFSDLNMLVAPGGRERTLDEYAELLAATGFRLHRAVPTDSGLSVIEGIAA
jgi:SAM-dependent methyltransferase